ncbi:MAG: hypothetical protein GX581_08385 [Syntrophomonadaceae bacterium]|jgi:hypothetical protein|nr:hypothetical protein [Syntrophomonadaceae bacterium]
MFLDLVDRKHSLFKKALGKDRIDPGSFSFLESGWWVLHTLAITGVFLLGCKISSSTHEHSRERPEGGL